ncbi:PRC-barrel domain containing protein [Asanoa sp. WMMD1127]|uniref:PRC-barrel domain containing protein n=1 Tax=Asanoa sp. WMMD1127 TaxID=3016107 RepID=UPI002415D6AA|nr:PRC-barrel domain containing protein [Asanoa sp. WMMD1127]MDG4822706.1 PRC-barrel domain containing protein [Asanoa sp. WMMD1127]
MDVFNAWSWRTPALGGGHDQTTPDRDPDDPDLDRARSRTVEAADEGGPGFSIDLTGYAVAAVDGEIGKVEKATDTDLVVDTGPWIFGRSVLLPAGVVDRVDHQSRTVHVDRTKDQIKDAPEHADAPDYRDRLAHYYRDTYGSQ